MKCGRIAVPAHSSIPNSFLTRTIIVTFSNHQKTNNFAVGALMQRGISLSENGQTPVHTHWKHLFKLIQRGELDRCSWYPTESGSRISTKSTTNLRLARMPCKRSCRDQDPVPQGSRFSRADSVLSRRPVIRFGAEAP